MIKRIIPILMCAGTIAFTSAAIAQSVAQPSVMKSEVIATFRGDQNTLINAIGKVQQSTGGKVMEIRYSPVQGAAGYHAVVVKGGQVTFVHLDTSSQKITPVDANSGEPWMDNWRARSDVKLAGKAQVPLVEAIRTAQQFKSGPAVAAGIARSASNPDSDVHAYNVLVAVDGRASRVAVDDSSGQVIADPSALSGF